MWINYIQTKEKIKGNDLEIKLFEKAQKTGKNIKFSLRIIGLIFPKLSIAI